MLCAHGLRIRRIQRFGLSFRQLKELWGKFGPAEVSFVTPIPGGVRLAYFGQPPKCEVAHISLPIRPSKVRHSDIYPEPGEAHGTETKTKTS